MSIGGGIALIVIGAILTFALNVSISWIDLKIVGEILMAAGVVVLIFGIIVMARKRRTSASSRRQVPQPTGQNPPQSRPLPPHTESGFDQRNSGNGS